jgi:hypothetical protein
MAFDGLAEDTYEMLGSDSTIEASHRRRAPQVVDRATAHFFFYRRPGGGVVDDPRRWSVTPWSGDSVMTYQLEAALGRTAAIGSPNRFGSDRRAQPRSGTTR